MSGPVVITGGGTGGHVFPMQAVAEALRAQGLTTSELRYVGSRRGQEGRLLGNGDVALTLLPGRGLRRSWRPKDALVNLGAALGLAAAVVSAIALLRRWRPPLVLVELDATPGAAQRIVGRYAVKRCCAFPVEGANVVVTGAPLRAGIEAVDRSKAARDAAKAAQTPPSAPARLVVVVMTGSLGSARVNRAVRELATKWDSRDDRAIVHVTGRRDFDEVRARLPSSNGLDYRVIAFGDMVELWTLCDVAICRAGAVTIAELT